jgi:hypothetical protein
MLERLDLGKLKKQGRIKIGAPQPKGRKSKSSSVPVRSGKTLPRISEWSSLERFPISTVSILKTFASTRNTQEKKNVCFKEDSEIEQIRFIPVAEGSRHVPIQRKVANQQLQLKDPDLTDVVYTVLCQESKWMTVSHNCVRIIRIR